MQVVFNLSCKIQNQVRGNFQPLIVDTRILRRKDEKSMERICVYEDDTATLERVNDLLDAAGIDYDFDDGDRYIIQSEDVDEALNIMEEVGVDADLV